MIGHVLILFLLLFTVGLGIRLRSNCDKIAFSIVCISTALGETMLHCACIRGDLKAVVSLVEGGSDVHALDNAS